MKIILHIGMPKAGSSALQAGLSAMRPALVRAGVLYPTGGGSHNDHQLLINGLVGFERLPRGLRHKYHDDPEAIEFAMLAWFRRLHQEINACKPQKLVLSSEYLFRVETPDGCTRLARRLRKLGNEIDVVSYVRRPSEQYLASVQQALKASYRFVSPQPIKYKATLQSYAGGLADRTHVIRYDPSVWPSGDILQHFLTTFMPEVVTPVLPDPQNINRSLSGESMALLAEYRRRFWPNDNNRSTPDTDRFIDALMIVDDEVGGDRNPVLQEHVRHSVDYGSSDILWLRDKYGVIFDGIDYDDIRTCGYTRDKPTIIDEICVVDLARKAELARRLSPDVKRGPARGVSSNTTSLYAALARRIARVV